MLRTWLAFAALLVALAVSQSVLAGDNIDTPGVFRSGTRHLSNSFGGSGDYVFAYGIAGTR